MSDIDKLSNHFVDLATGFDGDDFLEALVVTALCTIQAFDDCDVPTARAKLAKLTHELPRWRPKGGATIPPQ